MHEDLTKAAQRLKAGEHTCVLCRGEVYLTDARRGIRPLLELYESDSVFSGFFAADRVVGKAAAFLYCLLGVSGVYAQVISEPAVQVLGSHGIDVVYDALVPAIRNRAGDGFCPMETAVWALDDPQKAPDAIREALKKL